MIPQGAPARAAGSPLSRRLVAGVALAYLALAALQTRIYGDVFTQLYGGGRGDPGQHAWALARVTAQLSSEPWRPFAGNLYYPSRNSVLYGDPLLGPAVLVLPLRLAGADAVLLYNAAVLLSFLVASLGCFSLARRLGTGLAGAFLAGLVVPFTSHQLAHLVHLNLAAIPFLPWALRASIDLLERPGWRPALGAGAAFALQAATSGYHAFGAALMLVVAGAWGWKSLLRPRVLAWACAAGLAAATCLFPYVAGFAELRRDEAQMSRPPGIASALGLDLADLFVSGTWVWRRVLPGREPFFPGLVVLLLAARGLGEVRRDRYARLLVLVAGASLLMALGPEVHWRETKLGPGPFALAAQVVPFLDAMRHPFTLAVPGLMALGLLAAKGFSATAWSRRPVLAGAVMLAAVLESLGDTPARREAPRSLPAVYADLARLAAAEPAAGPPLPATLELPFRDAAATWRAAFHDLPIVNGVGAFEPRRYQALWQLFQRASRLPPRDFEPSLALEYLKTWFPIRFVLVHARGGERWRRLADATPRSFELVAESADGDRIYRFRRGGSGKELSRSLRGDQLRHGVLAVRVSARQPATLVARLNGRPLRVEGVSSVPRAVEWAVAPVDVRPGLNMLELELAGGGDAALILDDVWAR